MFWPSQTASSCLSPDGVLFRLKQAKRLAGCQLENKIQIGAMDKKRFDLATLIGTVLTFCALGIIALVWPLYLEM